MFGRVIRDKLPSNKTCDYWLIPPTQQTLFIETNFCQLRELANGQLQNNSINGAMLI